ncbi:FAS-associated death domain protein-like isoform X3 [Hydra vulgaris]|uniref:FAS-associated death domain protein-like isoform X3 n=1 Tax=Hydra vulgaris TaxID=6087 RepID=A0ABM4DG41_HYDVU
MDHKKKMIEVGKKLDADNIAVIKYVVARDIGEGIHKITNGLEMIKELERIGYVGENNYDDLIKILYTQKRNDLISIINGEPQPDNETKIDNHELTPDLVDKVANKVGADWCNFGRHLKLRESELGHIDIDYPKTLTKSVEVLNRWIKIQEKNQFLTWCNLKKELESFNRRDIVKEIQIEYMQEENNAYNDKLTPSQMDLIASKISNNWNDFGRVLNLNENELDHIDIDFKKVHDKAYNVLRQCKQKSKEGYLTWEHLKKELELLNRFDIVEELQEKFKH